MNCQLSNPGNKKKWITKMKLSLSSNKMKWGPLLL